MSRPSCAAPCPAPLIADTTNYALVEDAEDDWQDSAQTHDTAWQGDDIDFAPPPPLAAAPLDRRPVVQQPVLKKPHVVEQGRVRSPASRLRSRTRTDLRTAAAQPAGRTGHRATHTLSNEALEENARMLESVLDDYGVKGEISPSAPAPSSPCMNWNPRRA